MTKGKRKVSEWCYSCEEFTKNKVLLTRKSDGKKFYKLKDAPEALPLVCLGCLYWRFCDTEIGRMPRYVKGEIETGEM